MWSRTSIARTAARRVQADAESQVSQFGKSGVTAGVKRDWTADSASVTLPAAVLSNSGA